MTSFGAWKNRWVIVATTCLLSAGVVLSAEKTDLDDLQKQVQELQRQVAELKASGTNTARLEETERQIQVLAAEIERLKLGEAQPEPTEGIYCLGPSASKIYTVKKGVAFGGYGEMLYSAPSSSLQDGSPSGLTSKIDLLRGVFYFGAKFNDRIVFNSELEVEHVTTGEGAEERGEVALEFAYIDFFIREAVNVRAGLLLVPMGFINERHEPPTYLGARRPLVETAIIPTTWSEDGVGVFGDIGSKIAYRAYITSGLAAAAGTSSGAEGYSAAGIRDGRSHGAQASAERLALSGRVDGSPVAGLTIGASFFAGDAGQDLPYSGGRLKARTILADGHAEYRWRGLAARALYAHTTVDHAEDVNVAQGYVGDESVGSRQYGWYGEVGYDVLAYRKNERQSFIPYARYERLNTQSAVPAGYSADPANDVDLFTIGAMWKPIPNIAVKLDWSQLHDQAQTGYDEINASLGFMF